MKFQELCAWTLGNLSASDNKVAKLLESQGLVNNLISLLSDNYDDNIIDSAAYALGHMIYSNFDLLKCVFILYDYFSYLFINR